MYPGKMPNPQNGPQGPGDNQPNHLSKHGADHLASDSEQPAGQRPTGPTMDGKHQNRYIHPPRDLVQKGTKCSCHRS
jgi:hypothetical protein